jgi:phosphoribosylformylglycinamidine synthase
MTLKAKINVFLKSGILDPQGKAVLHAIEHLDYQGVKNVRIGKFIEIDFAAQDANQVKQQAEEICNKLLANPVMENFSIDIVEDIKTK